MMVRSARILGMTALVLASWIGSPAQGSAQNLLIPMDRSQVDHLKAYGLTFWLLQRGEAAEWLLNYRGGAFLLPDTEMVRREAALRGVTAQPVSGGDVASIRATIADSNMESVPLERAPRIAIYTPPNTTPWDDAVTMALEYAGIAYDRVWDSEVLNGGLSRYEWLHLHHEDFTGQFSKFHISFARAPWLREEVERNQEVARSFGFSDVPALKKAVAGRIRDFVEGGGFLFAMCSATETLELALAGADVNFALPFAAGTQPDPQASAKMAWERTMAFRGAQLQLAPTVNAFSDIDSHQVNTPWRLPLGSFRIFGFSAKFDPVPSMLTQNHESLIPDFYGLTTGYRIDRLKPGVTILAQEGDVAKYIHGSFGEGTWTYFGGHDPEDAEHQIGDPETDLSLYPNSPGYRLILNNVLFPAARKKQLKT